MESITEVCNKLYHLHGQGAIEELMNNIQWEHYARCQPCETIAPVYDGACLICGSVIE